MDLACSLYSLQTRSVIGDTYLIPPVITSLPVVRSGGCFQPLPIIPPSLRLAVSVPEFVFISHTGVLRGAEGGVRTNSNAELESRSGRGTPPTNGRNGGGRCVLLLSQPKIFAESVECWLKTTLLRALPGEALGSWTKRARAYKFLKNQLAANGLGLINDAGPATPTLSLARAELALRVLARFFSEAEERGKKRERKKGERGGFMLYHSLRGERERDTQDRFNDMCGANVILPAFIPNGIQGSKSPQAAWLKLTDSNSLASHIKHSCHGQKISNRY